jgi:hypothetical protein
MKIDSEKRSLRGDPAPQCREDSGSDQADDDESAEGAEQRIQAEIGPAFSHALHWTPRKMRPGFDGGDELPHSRRDTAIR